MQLGVKPAIEVCSDIRIALQLLISFKATGKKMLKGRVYMNHHAVGASGELQRLGVLENTSSDLRQRIKVVAHEQRQIKRTGADELDVSADTTRFI